MERNIIRLDLDAFFVAVECKRDAGLKGKPLITGGSSRRGVVAPARANTIDVNKRVRMEMNMFKAK